MKKILFFLSFLFLASASFSQVEEDVDNDEINTLLGDIESHGGYVSFGLTYTGLDKKDGLSLGGGLAWIVNHNVAFGLAGYGFFNEPTPNATLDNTLTNEYSLAGGYGGLLIEPILGAKQPLHFSFPVIIGAGGVAYSRIYNRDTWNADYDYTVDSDAFFAIRPGIEVELNMLKFLRVALGAYYCYTTEVELTSVSDDKLVNNDVLRGFSFGLNFKFCKF